MKLANVERIQKIVPQKPTELYAIIRVSFVSNCEVLHDIIPWGLYASGANSVLRSLELIWTSTTNYAKIKLGSEWLLSILQSSILRGVSLNCNLVSL